MMLTRKVLPPHPSLAVESPSTRFQPALFAASIADVCRVLCEADTLAKATDGDLERLITLGTLAYEEKKAREGAPTRLGRRDKEQQRCFHHHPSKMD